MPDVISKSIRLLHALVPNEQEQEWGATELSKKLDMPVQTVHRLLSSLAKHGFVYKNLETRKFRLGFTLMHLGFTVWGNLAIRQVARPFMEQLTSRTKESCFLTLRDGNDGIFIDSIDSYPFIRISEPAGMRLPLYREASTKVILAHLPSTTQHHILQVPVGEGNVALPFELEEIKNKGYSLETEDKIGGMTCISFPIFNWEEQPIASLSLKGSNARFTKGRIDEFIFEIKIAAREISRELGWVKKRGN